MYHRVFNIEEQLDEGMFLFGAFSAASWKWLLSPTER